MQSKQSKDGQQNLFPALVTVAYVVWIRSLTLAVGSGQPGPYQLGVGSCAVRRNKRISIHHIGDEDGISARRHGTNIGAHRALVYRALETLFERTQASM